MHIKIVLIHALLANCAKNRLAVLTNMDRIRLERLVCNVHLYEIIGAPIIEIQLADKRAISSTLV